MVPPRGCPLPSPEWTRPNVTWGNHPSSPAPQRVMVRPRGRPPPQPRMGPSCPRGITAPAAGPRRRSLGEGLAQIYHHRGLLAAAAQALVERHRAQSQALTGSVAAARGPSTSGGALGGLPPCRRGSKLSAARLLPHGLFLPPRPAVPQSQGQLRQCCAALPFPCVRGAALPGRPLLSGGSWTPKEGLRLEGRGRGGGAWSNRIGMEIGIGIGPFSPLPSPRERSGGRGAWTECKEEFRFSAIMGDGESQGWWAGLGLGEGREELHLSRLAK